MKQPSAADTTRARHLLALEGARADASPADAAGRVYDKLQVHVAPLVGDAGVRMLFARSAKVAQRAHPCLADAAIVESSARLRGVLLTQEAAVAAESAAALFASFFALISSFIGERLTTQVLRSAWPEIVDGASPPERTP